MVHACVRSYVVVDVVDVEVDEVRVVEVDVVVVVVVVEVILSVTGFTRSKFNQRTAMSLSIAAYKKTDVEANASAVSFP